MKFAPLATLGGALAGWLTRRAQLEREMQSRPEGQQEPVHDDFITLIYAGAGALLGAIAGGWADLIKQETTNMDDEET